MKSHESQWRIEKTERGFVCVCWRGKRGRDWEELGPSCDLGSNYTGNASLGRVEEPLLWDFPGRNCWSEVPGIQEFPKQTQAPTR